MSAVDAQDTESCANSMLNVPSIQKIFAEITPEVRQQFIQRFTQAVDQYYSNGKPLGLVIFQYKIGGCKQHQEKEAYYFVEANEIMNN